MVAASWRLERAERLEAELFAHETYELFDIAPDLGLALIRDCNGAGAFDTLLRYRSGTLAELWRALRTLKALQAERAAPTHAAERAQGAQPNEPEARADAGEFACRSGLGSGSHHAFGKDRAGYRRTGCPHRCARQSLFLPRHRSNPQEAERT